MQVLIFCKLGLKTPIHTPKIGGLEGFDRLNGEVSHHNPQKALPCMETHCMTYRSSVGPLMWPVRMMKRPKKERQRKKS